MSEASELDKIGKIIACLDSPHEAEAIAALRLARARLAALGLTLADWYRLQPGAPIMLTPAPPPPAPPAHNHWQRVATEAADRLWQLGEELYAMGLDKHLDLKLDKRQKTS